MASADHFEDDVLYGRPDIWELTEYSNVSTKWRLMGVRLHLDGDILDEIESSNDPLDTKLEKMYNSWLRNHEEATRKLVLDALKSKSIGEVVLANNYEKCLRDGTMKPRLPPDPTPLVIQHHLNTRQPSPAPVIIHSDDVHVATVEEHITDSQPALDEVTEFDSNTTGGSSSQQLESGDPKTPECTCKCDTCCRLGRYICKHWGKCTKGDRINYLLSIGFVAIFVSCVIVIVTLGSLQIDISRFFIDNTLLFDCYLFADCGQNGSSCNFQLNSYSCGTMWAAYTLIGTVSLGLAIASIVKAIVRIRLVNTKLWYLIIEMVVLILFLLLSFGMSIMISVGSLTTCRSIERFYDRTRKCENGIIFPYSDFEHYSRNKLIESTAWIIFLSLFIAVIIFIIRLVIYTKRKRQQQHIS